MMLPNVPRGEAVFASLLGLVDGVLTSLTLSSGRIVLGEGVSGSLAFRIAGLTALSSAFVYFVAEYTSLRQSLIRAEKQLNITTPGKFATTALAQGVLVQASAETGIAIVCGFLGALIPLLVNVIFPGAGLVSIVVALCCLGLLGMFIARSIHASVIAWAGGLLACGVALSVIGAELRFV
jgi:VIT1/CCC1 family predicted Fe2+/Mn2+ transporter